jgi:5S rRNA maturation endonuclease (ribonuclease M5)
MISKGIDQLSLEQILFQVDEISIAKYYLKLSKLPCLINSPLRIDNKPSMSIYYCNNHVYYKDYSSGDMGGLFNLLQLLWKMSFYDMLLKINNDIPEILKVHSEYTKNSYTYTNFITNNTKKLECTIRKWEDYDIQYWESYGVSLEWLKYCNVFPISHKFITIDDKTFTFKADKYAYSFIEKKEGKITMKIYQPYNTKGYKWTNSHDSSVLSLWTKIPDKGNLLLICSSLKDALCIRTNTNIPTIAVQGEGYFISKRVIKELNERYKNIIISFDGDEAGITNAKKLSKHTNWVNINSPTLQKGDIKAKDWSDIYYYFGKEIFLKIFKELIL